MSSGEDYPNEAPAEQAGAFLMPEGVDPETGIYVKPRASGTQQLDRPALAPARERNAALTMLFGGKTVIYAMRVPGNLVKIGCTSQIVHRRIELRGEILGLREGDFDEESELHKSLREHVHHGREWYHPTAAVLSVVNEMREPFGLEPLEPGSF